jgi:hypothetical protein
VLALVIVLAVPGARAAAAMFLHAWGIDIFRVPAIADARCESFTRSGSVRSTTLADARIRRASRARSERSALGRPMRSIATGQMSGARQRISLVYAQRAGIPISHEPGVQRARRGVPRDVR